MNGVVWPLLGAEDETSDSPAEIEAANARAAEAATPAAELPAAALAAPLSLV